MTSKRERERFDEILERVMGELPRYVTEMLEEVPIIIEDEPSREILAEMKIEARPGEADLCGLHSGIPIGERETMNAPLPSSIMIFRGPILRLAEHDDHRLEDEIRVTLLHEIGHHFGFDEDELRELGYE